MKKIKVISFIAMLLVSVLNFCSIAAEVVVWTEGDHTIPSPGLAIAEKLDTYNDVTVTMYDGGGVSTFNMHNSSKLTMYDGVISNKLNLYDNTSASIFGFDDIQSVWIEPESTALVKLYAVEIFHDLQYGWIQGYWLNNPQSIFTIDLLGNYSDTYSHIQFIPEPATIALLAVGFFAIHKRRKR